jgi:hypothetical protein
LRVSAGQRKERVAGVPIRAGTLSKLPVHPWSASEFIPEIEWGDMSRPDGACIRYQNSKDDGGPLTPQIHIDQINEPYLCRPRSSSKQGERVALFSM